MKCEVKASKGRGVKRAGEGRRLSFGEPAHFWQDRQTV